MRQAITFLNQSPSAVRDVRTGGRTTRSERRNDEGLDSVAQTFELLLDSTFAMMRERSAVDPKVSASLMFEPAADNSRANRQAVMQGQYRAETEAASAGRRPDPTSVDQRSAARDSERSASVRAAIGLPSIAERIGSSARPAVGGPSQGELLDRPSSGGQVRANGDAISATESSSYSQGGMSSDRGSARPRAEVGVAVSVRGPAAPGSTGSQPSRVANQVAKLLSVDRTSSGESLRMEGSIVGRADARSTGGTSRAPQRTASGLGSREGQPAQAGARTSATEPSEFDRLVRSIRTMHSGTRLSSARIHLNPPSLGRVMVDVEMRGDSLRLNVVTETDAARELVEARATQLRAALEQVGISIEDFSVTIERPDGQTLNFGPTDGNDVRSRARARNRIGERTDVDGGISAADPAFDADASDVNPLGTVGGRRRLDVRV